ncbi:MFS transporter [Lentilactobacillus curieae]|uniref:MFS transporter n=1 Tax=Lentilactobacillus curieae TaxID=1138822 RepID=A0A1S6QI80_9LACO|nr:MFS transporter [Lentilactobacillus curieae]AQW21325.1 MFS transporter [Lentilactobacillus curieae]
MEQKIERKTYLAIFATALLSFTGILTETSMNVTFPELAKQFSVSLDILQWITTGYLLMVTLVMATTSFLLKKFPAKNLLIFAATSFIIGDILCAIAMNFPVLLVGRLIQAIATGLSTPIMYQIIFAKIPQNKIGTMTGVAGMVISFAPALGPTYGGIVATMLDWRMIFWLVLPIVVASLILGYLYVDLENSGTDKSFDTVSLILIAISFTSIVIGVSQSGSVGIGNIKAIAPIVLGIIAIAAFLFSNGRGKSQLFDLSIYSSVNITLSTITYFILQFINIGISFLIPVYCQYVMHTSSMVSGLILLPGALVGAFTSPFAGKLADTKGYALPIIIGTCAVTLGSLLYFLTQSLLGSILVAALYIFLRFGFNMAFSNSIGNATTLVKPQNSPDVNSVFNMLQQYAGSLGVGILAAMLSNAQLRGTGSFISRTFAGGQIAFIFLAVLGAIATVSAIINFTMQNKNTTKREY